MWEFLCQVINSNKSINIVKSVRMCINECFDGTILSIIGDFCDHKEILRVAQNSSGIAYVSYLYSKIKLFRRYAVFHRTMNIKIVAVGYVTG